MKTRGSILLLVVSYIENVSLTYVMSGGGFAFCDDDGYCSS
jgi:hypothetical protein